MLMHASSTLLGTSSIGKQYIRSVTRDRLRQAWSRFVQESSQSIEKLDALRGPGEAETVVASGAIVDALIDSNYSKT